MLVEINLLPKKERQSMLGLIIFLAVLALLVALAAGLFMYYLSIKNDIDLAQRELDQLTQMRLAYEEKMTAGQESTSIQELEEKIAWVESQRISNVKLLSSFVKLLPERGFFLEYAVSEDGKVTIQVQFDTSRQSSSYMHELTELEFVKNAQITSISAEPLEEFENDFDYLPRYIVTYELEIDYNALKAAEEE